MSSGSLLAYSIWACMISVFLLCLTLLKVFWVLHKRTLYILEHGRLFWSTAYMLSTVLLPSYSVENAHQMERMCMRMHLCLCIHSLSILHFQIIVSMIVFAPFPQCEACYLPALQRSLRWKTSLKLVAVPKEATPSIPSTFSSFGDWVPLPGESLLVFQAHCDQPFPLSVSNDISHLHWQSYSSKQLGKEKQRDSPMWDATIK